MVDTTKIALLYTSPREDRKKKSRAWLVGAKTSRSAGEGKARSTDSKGSHYSIKGKISSFISFIFAYPLFSLISWHDAYRPIGGESWLKYKNKYDFSNMT